jgi:hypothetical protein
VATQKPISTISYNTEAFLREKLETWYQKHIIQSYQYICHKGEDGDKDHIHVRIEPNKRIDPMEIQDALWEYTIDNPTKPLGCRPFRPSKEEDWILYVVHDPQYLKLKYGGGEKGEKIPYSWEDIRVPEYYDMEVAFIRAKASMEHTSANMASKISSGTSPIDLIMQGENSFLVNSITRALSENDYRRVQNELSKTREALAIAEANLSDLERLINNEGYVIECDENGLLKLCKMDP